MLYLLFNIILIKSTLFGAAPKEKVIIMKIKTSQLKSLIKESIHEVMKEQAVELKKFTSAEEAYWWALKNDLALKNDAQSDAARNVASKHPEYAFKYARDIDRDSHDVTRLGAWEPMYAFLYAKDIEGPHDVTRKAASKDPAHAFKYAYHIDKGPHNLTREMASKDPEYAFHYAEHVDKGPHEVTYFGAEKDEDILDQYVDEIGMP